MPAAEYLAHARAGLIGNPSDGYHGKTISFIVRNFAARVTIEASHAIEIVPNDRDHSQFESMLQLRQDVRRYGYYGGVRLLKAACKVFGDYCESQHIDLPKRNFRLSYRSDIPDHVGLAGSSAIITACFRALMGFYDVSIPREILPGLILSAEKNELKIPAGLQDRVIQVYEGVVFMDFAREHMDQHGHGFYEELDPALLPPLYIAYSTELSEGTEVFHNDMRARYDRGDPHVRSAIQRWAHLAEQTKFMLLRRQTRSIPPLLDENFDLRRSICPLNPGHVRMIETARSVGVSAKFTGSGGAIVGICDDEPTFQRLSEAMEPLSVKVIRPKVT